MNDTYYRRDLDGRITLHDGSQLLADLPEPSLDAPVALVVLTDALGDDAKCPVCRGNGITYYDPQIQDDIPWDYRLHPEHSHPDVSKCWSCRGTGRGVLPHRQFWGNVLSHLGEQWTLPQSKVLDWCRANLPLSDAARTLAARSVVRWLDTAQPDNTRIPESVAVAPPGPVVTRVLRVEPAARAGLPIVTVLARDGFPQGESGAWSTLFEQAGAKVVSVAATRSGVIELHFGTAAHPSLRTPRDGAAEAVMPDGLRAVKVSGDPDSWESYTVSEGISE